MKTFPKPLSAQEERLYLEQLQQGNQAAKDILIERNMRLVAHMVKKYATNEWDTEDLISVGSIGLMKAVNTFDPTKATRLGTCKTENGITRYAPLCIHKFLLIAPHKLTDAELLNQKYHSYDEIQTVPERLRWCRHQKGMLQREVADLVGISRKQYIDYETGRVDGYDVEILEKIAKLFQVPVTDFLDEYNLFLYRGQDKLIREYRLSLGLKKSEFCKKLGVSESCIRTWEKDEKRINKNSWEKYFKGKIKC